MLRATGVTLHYRAKLELDRIRGMLRGRARLERKVGLKRLFFLMRTQTRYRVEQQSLWNRAIVRKNVDSAAREHGTSWSYIRNDTARQNVTLLPKTLQMLAQYEPLAFRSLMEICASNIPPPPPPKTAVVPEETYELHSPKQEPEASEEQKGPAPSHPAAQKELRELVNQMMKDMASSGNAELCSQSPRSADEWMDAWKAYDVPRK